MASGRKWGGVARRGADNVAPEKRQGQPRGKGGRGQGARSEGAGGRGGRSGGGRGRDARDQRDRTGRPPPRSGERKGAPELGPPPAWEPEEWIQEPDEPVRAEAGKAVARGARSGKKPAEAPKDRPRRKAPADVARD